jgi:hypothetical protein
MQVLMTFSKQSQDYRPCADQYFYDVQKGRGRFRTVHISRKFLVLSSLCKQIASKGLGTNLRCPSLRWAVFEQLKFMAYVAKTLRCRIICEGLFVYEKVKGTVIFANHTQKRDVENDYLTTILLIA